jgi:hypothetical protein
MTSNASVDLTGSDAAPGSAEKKQESRDAQKVVRLLAKKLKSLGFQRTKSSIFTRPKVHVIEFVHIHKFTFAPSFRLHFGVRVRSDDFAGAHLNGPSSDAMEDPLVPNRRRYHFCFGTDAASWESCADRLSECVLAEGLAWFASIEKPEQLLSPDSPLTPQARAALRRELDGPSSVQASESTRSVFNAA